MMICLCIFSTHSTYEKRPQLNFSCQKVKKIIGLFFSIFSSPARYLLSRDRIRLPSGGEEESISQASPSGSVTSLESSVSSAAVKALGLKPFVRSNPWKLNTKNYKDVLIRTYSSFAQIILSPSTTGLKQSINANVCEELTDALR